MATPLDDQMCGDCRFFIEDGNRISGECHRRPPKIKRRPERDESWNCGIWPAVQVGDWCGEFVEREL